MIRAQYIKLLADSKGILTDDSVNERIAEHCETKIRSILQVCLPSIITFYIIYFISLS